MKLLQVCVTDQLVSIIISGLVAGIKLIPRHTLAQNLSNDRAHINSGLLLFIGEFQKKNNL